MNLIFLLISYRLWSWWNRNEINRKKNIKTNKEIGLDSLVLQNGKFINRKCVKNWGKIIAELNIIEKYIYTINLKCNLIDS